MYYFGYENLGEAVGGVQFDPHANSYIVWARDTSKSIVRHLTPAYGNGVDAIDRLCDELLLIDEGATNGNS